MTIIKKPLRGCILIDFCRAKVFLFDLSDLFKRLYDLKDWCNYYSP